LPLRVEVETSVVDLLRSYSMLGDTPRNMSEGKEEEEDEEEESAW
jgi:hypothetical protein